MEVPLDARLEALENEVRRLTERVEKLERTAGEVWIAGGFVTAKEVRAHVEERLAFLVKRLVREFREGRL